MAAVVRFAIGYCPGTRLYMVVLRSGRWCEIVSDGIRSKRRAKQVQSFARRLWEEDRASQERVAKMIKDAIRRQSGVPLDSASNPSPGR